MRFATGSVVLSVILLAVAGCGGNGDQLQKRRIELLNAKAGELESLPRKSSLQDIQEATKRIAKIDADLKETELAMEKFSIVERRTIRERHKAEADEADLRLLKASVAIMPKVAPRKKTG